MHRREVGYKKNCYQSERCDLRMRERLNRFMAGRYGNDQLNRTILILGLIFFVFSAFGMGVFYILGLACLLYVYFRFLSKNIYKRSEENSKYLQYEYKVKKFFSALKQDLQQRRTHHIYRCPSCRQKIRIPRGKGKIEICCPKCRQKFIKNS